MNTMFPGSQFTAIYILKEKLPSVFKFAKIYYDVLTNFLRTFFHKDPNVWGDVVFIWQIFLLKSLLTLEYSIILQTVGDTPRCFTIRGIVVFNSSFL